MSANRPGREATHPAATTGLSIGLFCPTCSRYGIHPLGTEPSTVRCPDCRSEVALASWGDPQACPLCRNREFYARKDFPQQIGCAAVTLTIVASSVAYGLWGVPASILVLALATLVDALLYYRLPQVVVCYRCQTELRGAPPRPGIHPFDIARAEEYEKGR